MDDLPVPRAYLHRLHVFGLREVRRDVEVLVVDGAGRRDLEVLLHLEHDVGLTDRPALGIVRRRRLVLQIALRRAARGPGEDCLFLLVSQLAFVFERTGRRVRVPRRHVPLADLVANGLRIRTGVLIRQKRHRRDLAGTMTGGAVLVHDGRHVLGKGRDRRRRGPFRSRGRQRRGERVSKKAKNACGTAETDRRLDAHGLEL